MLQGVTIIVTAITLVANLNSAKRENAKKRMVEITIRHRLEEMKELKALSAQYLTYLHPDVADSIAHSDYVIKLLSIYNEICSLLKIKYEQDKTLRQQIELAYKIAVQYNLTRDEQGKTALSDCIEKLYALFSIYSYANWICIKEQAYGDELKSVDYRRIYDENYPHFMQK